MTDAPQRRAILHLVSVVAGLVIGVLALQIAASGERQQFDELALGALTTSMFPAIDGDPIHGQYVDTIAPVLAGFERRGMKDVVLWLGNSQLHAINQAGPEAKPASAKLHRNLAPRGFELLTFSQPNANLQEHYLVFEYLRQRLPIRVLLLPVVFDDLRETGIRDKLTAALEDAAVREALATTGVGRRLLEANSEVAKQDVHDTDLGGVRDTFQEHSESMLNGWLERNSSLWAARPELRGRIFNGLYQLRNRAFGISAQTKRRIIPGRYASNMEALDALLGRARANGIVVLMYIVPLRSDVATPYKESEYAKFKAEVEARAGASGVAFANLETLVPGEYWGQMQDQAGRGAGFDFMHFKEAGHVLLGEALERELLGLPELEGTLAE